MITKKRNEMLEKKDKFEENKEIKKKKKHRVLFSGMLCLQIVKYVHLSVFIVFRCEIGAIGSISLSEIRCANRFRVCVEIYRIIYRMEKRKACLFFAAARQVFALSGRNLK